MSSKNIISLSLGSITLSLQKSNTSNKFFDAWMIAFSQLSQEKRNQITNTYGSDTNVIRNRLPTAEMLQGFVPPVTAPAKPTNWELQMNNGGIARKG